MHFILLKLEFIETCKIGMVIFLQNISALRERGQLREDIRADSTGHKKATTNA